MLGKTVSENFKTKKRRKASPDELLIFPDTHEAIIDQETWDLANKLRKRSPKKADINRFIALVRKYQVVTEVTDAMLYEFIDRVEVHAATGGSTRYRQQIIDIHFNFVGQFVPPGSVMSEEERIVMIDAEQEEKLAAKRKRSAKNQAKRLASLKERAKTDPQATAEVDEIRAR